VRASTSGHANLIRDEGNTDPSHAGKMPVKLSYKTQAKGQAWARTTPTPPRRATGEDDYRARVAKHSVVWACNTRDRSNHSGAMRVRMSRNVGSLL